MVRDAALRTKGSGGPSRFDANGFWRILASKSFKKSGTDLGATIAAITRPLCTEFINSIGIEAILANRLFPLDKREGAAPGERCRRRFTELNGKARCH